MEYCALLVPNTPSLHHSITPSKPRRGLHVAAGLKEGKFGWQAEEGADEVGWEALGGAVVPGGGVVVALAGAVEPVVAEDQEQEEERGGAGENADREHAPAASHLQVAAQLRLRLAEVLGPDPNLGGALRNRLAGDAALLRGADLRRPPDDL